MEKKKEYLKKYYKKNEKKINEKRREYRKNNEEKVRTQDREYYQKNKERILKWQREYYSKNSEKRKKYLTENVDHYKKWRKEHYQKNKEELKKMRIKIKKQLVEYKGGECNKCGYNKSIASLDFHHLNGKKEFHVSHAITKNIEFDKLKIETDKCMLLCANCHRELHYTPS